MSALKINLPDNLKDKNYLLHIMYNDGNQDTFVKSFAEIIELHSLSGCNIRRIDVYEAYPP